jgi:hypothetical protein
MAGWFSAIKIGRQSILSKPNSACNTLTPLFMMTIAQQRCERHLVRLSRFPVVDSGRALAGARCLPANTMDDRCADGRFLMSSIEVAISNEDSLSIAVK